LYDVIVVGAGPAGSYLAYKLADMGHGVVVLERKETFSEPVCCTGVISRECVSEFDIGEDIIFRWANGATLFSPSGKQLRLWRDKPPACVIDRAAFDMAMAERAQGAGAEYVLSSFVRNVEVGGGVKVEAVRRGEKLNFGARAVVIASGLASGFTGKLGLGDIGDFVMGAQAEVETVGVDGIEVYLGRKRAPGFFAWLVPTSSPRALVGLASRRSTGSYMRRLLSSLLAEGKITSTEVQIRYKKIPLRPLAKTYGDRLLVVGDAAGQVKPTTGGGIYYGLFCAGIAADNLHRALAADDLSARSLAGYERGWKRKLGRELKVGQYARKFYERLSDRNLDRVFDITKSSGVDEVLSKADDISFDWHGEAITKLVGNGVLMGAIKAVKIPFRL
jgi:digeranylgeranylglycerophospholipid reductase